MNNRIVLTISIVLISLLILVACSSDQRALVQTLVAPSAPPDEGQAVAAVSPEASQSPAGFTLLVTPTLDPISSGPMGTWTAIAQTVAPPTQDTTPYEIVLTGKPHFVEFHAWW